MKQDFKNKTWNSNNTIAWYFDNFDDYKSLKENGKIQRARILFLVDKIEILNTPIQMDKFQFYKNYHVPTQNNMQPFTSINVKNIEILNPPHIQKTFTSRYFGETLQKAKLKFTENHINRFIASSLSKHFVILTGLSGSGKTKLAQAFVYWITESTSQYCIIPVGADWTNREPLLGFPNALDPNKYVQPENNFLDVLIEAAKSENSDKPFFIILDEMNLSHVERYFADFLSAMETEEPIYLHSKNELTDAVPSKIKFPENLFIIGTVNVDETTYMFSPKVLDRAHVIEFRVSDEEMESFLKEPLKPDLKEIEGRGKEMGADFILKSRIRNAEFEHITEINVVLLEFFNELKKIGSEFGYRSASEIYRFAGMLNMLTEENGNKWDIDTIVDAAIIQKLLPKLHGSRSKLDPILKTLAALCYKKKEDYNDKIKIDNIDFKDKVKYPLSLEKILRMRVRVLSDGFTSFTEA